jgi:hypothetical protein
MTKRAFEWFYSRRTEDGGDFYRISFPVVLFYRKSREGERLKSLETLVNTSSQKAILHAVEDSRLAKWFDQENLELKGYSGVTGCPHWAIVTQNDWIDVLSYTAPLVERLA